MLKSLDDALQQQIRLKDEIDYFKESTKPKESVRKEKKALTSKNATILLNGRQKVLNAFESGIFPKGKPKKELTRALDCLVCVAKVSDRKQLKILTPKQMPQRLPIALAQVKEGNKSENLLNEMRQIIYSLYRAKEITKKMCNNKI